MPDFKTIRSKFSKEPKKMLMNILIIFLFGVLLILIGDISSSLVGKGSKEKSNSIEVDSGAAQDKGESPAPVSSSSSSVLGSDSYEEKTKRELVETLSNIDGVGRISVMINYEGSEQSVPAFNEIDSNKRIEEKDNEGGVRVTTENSKNQEIVVINNGSENKPMVVRQYNPKISGIVVVAEGAENPVIKERLFYAVKTVLNLQGSKVSVMPMKKNAMK